MATGGDVAEATVCDANSKGEGNTSSSSLSSLVKGETALSSKENEEWLELPEDFTPSKMDVIVGWARQNYHHEGNKMLRNLVRENVPRYMAARTKHDKGTIIVDILEAIRRESPTGVGLVRQNPQTGRWSYIGNDKAKDKIGHALRKSSRDYHKMQQNGHKRRPSLSPSYRTWSPHSHSHSSMSAQSTQLGGIRGTIDNNASGKNKLQLYTTTSTPSSTTASTGTSRQPVPPVVPSSASSGRIRHSSPPPIYPHHYPPPSHPHHPHHYPHPPASDSHHDYYYSRHPPPPHHHYPPHPHYPPSQQHPHYPPPPPPSSGGNYNDDHHHPRPGAFQAIHPPPPQSSPPSSAVPRTPVHVSSCSTSSFAPASKSNEYNVPVREVSVPKRPNSVNSNISSKSSGSSTRSSPSSASSPKLQQKPFYRPQSAGYPRPHGDSGSPIRFAYSNYGHHHPHYSHRSHHGTHPPAPGGPPPSRRTLTDNNYSRWEDQHPPKDHAPHPDHPSSSYSNDHHHARGPREEPRNYHSNEGAPVPTTSSRIPNAFNPPSAPADDLHDQDHVVSHRIFDEVEEQRREKEATDSKELGREYNNASGEKDHQHHHHPHAYSQYYSNPPPPQHHHHHPPPPSHYQ